MKLAMWFSIYIGNFREFADKRGYYVCETYGGHGIGEDMHMPPIVIHNSKAKIQF